jgi:hypothetical protein
MARVSSTDALVDLNRAFFLYRILRRARGKSLSSPIRASSNGNLVMDPPPNDL